MSSFKQKKARAQKASRPSIVVTISLDFGLAEQRDALVAEIAEAAKDARAGYDPAAEAQAKLLAINEQEKDSLVNVKLYRTDARVWAKLCADNEYNLTPVAHAAIVRGDARIIDGKTEIEQTPEEWEEFFDIIAPSDYTALTAASAVLNEREAANRVERLKKLSAGMTGSNES